MIMTGCVRRGRVGVTVTREKTAAIARWSVGRHQLIRALTAGGGGGRVDGWWVVAAGAEHSSYRHAKPGWCKHRLPSGHGYSLDLKTCLDNWLISAGDYDTEKLYVCTKNI